MGYRRSAAELKRSTHAKQSTLTWKICTCYCMCISTLSHRTQLLLDDERHRLLEEEARRTGRSIASLVREAIDTRYELARRDAARSHAAEVLLSAPRPADPEPDWAEVERELLDSAAAPDLS